MTVTVKSLEFLDPVGRCEQIGQIWNDFPELVIGRFNQCWSGKTPYKQWAQSRWEAFKTISKPALPEPRHLGWEHEIFELCFQETLTDLRTALWKRGEPSDAAIAFAHDTAVPNVLLDVSFELSRTARPSLPRPQELADSIVEPEELRGDTKFDGWTRVGYYEEEILSESFEKDLPIEKLQVCSGLVATDNVKELDGVRVPVARVDKSLLWKAADDWYRSAFGKLEGGLMVGFLHIGPAAHLFGLACHPVLIAGLGLTETAWPGPLRMVDSQGELALVLRSWKTEAIPADIAGRVYRLVGCDLLMRTDLCHLAYEASPSTVVVATRINRD